MPGGASEGSADFPQRKPPGALQRTTLRGSVLQGTAPTPSAVRRIGRGLARQDCLDRGEPVEPEVAQPRGDGTAYIMLTNNSRSEPDQLDAANPRPESRIGHIIEIKEEGGNHSAEKGTWSNLVLCGDPNIEEVGAMWNPESSEDGWFGSPDNCAIDNAGRLWISTAQGSGWGRTGKSDGLYALETEGDLRGHSKLFFRCPVGGELCGPYFADEDKTLFLALQELQPCPHPFQVAGGCGFLKTDKRRALVDKLTFLNQDLCNDATFQVSDSLDFAGRNNLAGCLCNLTHLTDDRPAKKRGCAEGQNLQDAPVGKRRRSLLQLKGPVQ